jgi:hypothetical protein
MNPYRSCNVIKMSSGFTVGVTKILCYGFQMCAVISSFGHSGAWYRQHLSKRRKSPITLHGIITRKAVFMTVNSNVHYIKTQGKGTQKNISRQSCMRKAFPSLLFLFKILFKFRSQ